MYLSVTAAAEQYAIPAGAVREVARTEVVTQVPGAPPAVLGITNVRGRVLPVVDLPALLGLSRDRGAPPARIVIAEHRGRQAALAVDAVTDVMTLPDPSEDADSPLLVGASLVGGGLVGIVDVAAVLDEVAEAVSP